MRPCFRCCVRPEENATRLSPFRASRLDQVPPRRNSAFRPTARPAAHKRNASWLSKVNPTTSLAMFQCASDRVSWPAALLADQIQRALNASPEPTSKIRTNTDRGGPRILGPPCCAPRAPGTPAMRDGDFKRERVSLALAIPPPPPSRVRGQTGFSGGRVSRSPAGERETSAELILLRERRLYLAVLEACWASSGARS